MSVAFTNFFFIVCLYTFPLSQFCFALLVLICHFSCIFSLQYFLFLRFQSSFCNFLQGYIFLLLFFFLYFYHFFFTLYTFHFNIFFTLTILILCTFFISIFSLLLSSASIYFLNCCLNIFLPEHLT